MQHILLTNVIQINYVHKIQTFCVKFLQIF